MSALAAVTLLSSACAQSPLSSGYAASATQTTETLYDGMVIRTANVVGNVSVRAYSFGPGFCTTKITIDDKSVNFAAPPATYGPWLDVKSHSGAFSFAISKEDKCDTRTEVQVRYWK